jgi:tryptophan synthase alpha chain
MSKLTSSRRIAHAFEGRKALITFITGGDPDIETTESLMEVLAESGADIIEIGIPFSDPVAEGPVIQAASKRSLDAGCTVDDLFDMVKRARESVSVPILFMTYVNPIFVYGKDRFMRRCVECGIDGIIVPDLPFEERDELLDVCEKHDVTLINLIAPTSQGRIEAIARASQGFLYCVSSLGVTGMRESIGSGIGALIEQARASSSTPCAIGFGISTPMQAAQMGEISDGVIVGSAIVSIIGEHGRESADAVARYVTSLRTGLDAGNDA